MRSFDNTYLSSQSLHCLLRTLSQYTQSAAPPAIVPSRNQNNKLVTPVQYLFFMSNVHSPQQCPTGHSYLYINNLCPNANDTDRTKSGVVYWYKHRYNLLKGIEHLISSDLQINYWPFKPFIGLFLVEVYVQKLFYAREIMKEIVKILTRISQLFLIRSRV